VKRREAIPNLSSVLNHDSGPMMRAMDTTRTLPMQRGAEKRIHNRFDKAQLVQVCSDLYGDCYAIARNISAGGMLIEMEYAPPMGSVVTVHFLAPLRDEESDVLDAVIVVRAEVKHHHYLNVSGGGEPVKVRAVGLRFVEFVDGPDATGAAIH
jgi:hypothetical protein